MKRVFAAKAIGLALAALILNLALTTGVIFAYAAVLKPWQRSALFEPEPSRIAAWTAPPGGGLLLFGLTGWLGRRVPARNPLAFALATWCAYVVLDVGSGFALGDASAMISWQMAVSMLIALAGALAGAAWARSQTSRSEAIT